MFFMDRWDKPLSWALLLETVKSLSATGTSKQRILVSESLESLSKHADGHQRIDQSYWGVVQRHGDFASHELAMVRFHFQVIDFGDSIPLHASMERSTGDTENAERNQCAPPPPGRCRALYQGVVIWKVFNFIVYLSDTYSNMAIIVFCIFEKSPKSFAFSFEVCFCFHFH